MALSVPSLPPLLRTLRIFRISSQIRLRYFKNTSFIFIVDFIVAILILILRLRLLPVFNSIRIPGNNNNNNNNPSSHVVFSIHSASCSGWTSSFLSSSLLLLQLLPLPPTTSTGCSCSSPARPQASASVRCAGLVTQGPRFSLRLFFFVLFRLVKFHISPLALRPPHH